MRRLSAIALIFTLLASSSSATAQDIERELGKSVADEIEKEFGVVDDPLLAGWVDRVGQKLAAASGRPNVKYRFKVLDSEDINAVAAPGGFIFINRGALRFVRSEDELAAVLGHEIGHVAGKHAMKQLTAQLLGTLALLGFKAIHAETLRAVGSVAGGLAMLKFSRDEENDADRRGLRNAVSTGYDGQAMVAFLKRLESTEKEKPDKFEAYFLTHPPTAERVKRVTKEPGTALTAANYAAMADGYAARSLYRQAVAAYRQALSLQPGDPSISDRLTDALRHAPTQRPVVRLASSQKDRVSAELSVTAEEIRAGREASQKDRAQLAAHLKESDESLEAAARSLSDASQMIGRRDGIRQRQFMRLARAFEGAVRAAGNLRSVRDMADETYSDLEKLTSDSSARAGDSNVALLQSSCRAALTDLGDGLKQARERSAQVKNGAHALRRAADNLVTSMRSPFGFTYGELDILDVQVSAGSDTLSDALAASRRPEVLIARARMNLLARRIDLATASVRPNDPAVLGIVSRYLGVASGELAVQTRSEGFGQAAVSIAEVQLRKSAAERSKNKKTKVLQNEEAAITQGLRWQNATVLFNLIANDLEKELAR